MAEDIAAAIDIAWLLIAGILVLFMQAGFAMLEAGFVRSKNVVNVLMKNLVDASLGAVVYFAVGWGVAYGVDGGSFIGSGNWFLTDFDDYASWFFQFAFAAAAATIAGGAMAERTKFRSYTIYAVFMIAFIYPTVTHWGWDDNGWLLSFGETGFVDFAGSTLVHSVGGWAALTGAIIVGARKGRFGKDGSVMAFPGHSLPLGFLGMFILWVGWYGFNAGSTLGLTDGGAALAAHVAVTTTLSAGAGGATAIIFSWIQYGKSDLSLSANGVLAGLVSITAGAATLEPWAAVIAGIVGGIVVVYGVALLDALKIDDPVGAVPVHLFAGIWGTLAVGLLSSQAMMESAWGVEGSYGILLGGGADLITAQVVGILAVAAWAGGLSALVFLGIKYTIGLRVSEAEEDAGLDVYEHGMEAYPEFTGGRDPFASLTSTRSES